MKLLARIVKPVYAHCDLPCGVYDPAQARIEAESVLKIMQKYQENDDQVFRTRALFIKEKRAELAKDHILTLWTDYFKPEHLEKFPELHELVWKAAKQASEAKKHTDPAVAEKLLEMIDQIADIFKQTKQA